MNNHVTFTGVCAEVGSSRQIVQGFDPLNSGGRASEVPVCFVPFGVKSLSLFIMFAVKSLSLIKDALDITERLFQSAVHL